MPVMVDKPIITPDEMLDLDDGKLYELIDGQLVEKSVGGIACKTAARLAGWFDEYAVKNNAGHALVEATYTCFPTDPGRVRRPDVSFIRAGRLPGETVPSGHISLAPDLAVEVVSPSNKIDELDQKIEEYFEAGVSEVWVVRTIPKSIRMHHRNGSERNVRFGEVLTSPDLLPGFSRPLSDLFQNIQV